MSVLFDIILALILAICVFIGYKRGLVHTLSKFLSYIISFTLANKFYVLLAKVFIRLPFLEAMLSEEPFTESMTFLDRFSLCFDEIKENIVIFGNDTVMANAKLIVDNAVSVMIASTMAAILTFVIAVLLLKLVLWLLDGLITKIPVLKQVNGALGGLFGLLNGFFWTWLVTNAFVQFLLPTLMEKFPNVFVTEIADSFIVQLCTKINPITYLIALINFIFH
ncbi:MAG: CvpA family protein [Clostridia bacterium]|nr:CvpA family protein [Clostridia bacterium]